ncbi:IS66 family insertion sequence element accessory protein TnpB [bacterium]|nr:IS66 family insertion sequence element accessory protein TnpB [bacterium]
MVQGRAALSGGELAEDPFSGCVFIFRNRRGISLKILGYDGQGFFPPTHCIHTKRTSCWRPAIRPLRPHRSGGRFRPWEWRRSGSTRREGACRRRTTGRGTSRPG